MNPFRHVLASVLTILLAACATAQKSPPPEIRLDKPVQAHPVPEPLKPMTVVAIPEPLPLPAQLKPLPTEPKPIAAADPPRAAPDPIDPRERVAQANDDARVAPAREGYLNAIQVWPYAEGALYQVYA